MELAIILISILVVVSLLVIFFLVIYNRFQEYIIRINEADASIDAVLRKRFDLLNKSVDFIKETVDTDTILPTIIRLRSQSVSNVELDKELYSAIEEFQSYAERYEDIKKNEGYVKTQINLMESESEIVALRKYYNDISSNYNKYVSSFPSNIVAFLKKYPKKQLFEERKEKKSILEELKA